MTEQTKNILTVAKNAAWKAGLYLLENADKVKHAVVNEKSKNDFVTTIDKTSEKIIIEHIHAHFPDHGILAEEGGSSKKSSGFQWIIDPLDGTTNYIKNIPVFTVSIAVQEDSQIIAGVVLNPIQKELFTALKGEGARLNEQPIKVSDEEDFSRAFLATGFPHHAKFDLPQFIQSFSEIFLYSAGIRRIGSAALDLCYTACGRFDGFWELGLKRWDMAAGSLIVSEAGGLVTDFHGDESYLNSGFIVAGNRNVHKRLINILSNYF